MFPKNIGCLCWTKSISRIPNLSFSHAHPPNIFRFFILYIFSRVFRLLPMFFPRFSPLFSYFFPTFLEFLSFFPTCSIFSPCFPIFVFFFLKPSPAALGATAQASDPGPGGPGGSGGAGAGHSQGQPESPGSLWGKWWSNGFLVDFDTFFRSEFWVLFDFLVVCCCYYYNFQRVYRWSIMGAGIILVLVIGRIDTQYV